MTGPKRCSERELLRVGVRGYLVPGSGVWFQCFSCRRVWTTFLRRGAKQPRGYWKCPAGCNYSA